MLSPRLIALQGIGFTPIALAVQGLIDYIEGGGTTTYIAEYELSKPRKWYVKRDKKLHIFANASDADAFIEADDNAKIAIAKAQKTSRLARKRLRDKIISVAAPESTVQIDRLAELVSRYAIPVNLPDLLKQQDYERVMQIMAIALQAQDDEDIEMLILAM